MNKDDYLAGILLMQQMGGGFARGIADAAIHADSANWQRLLTAFQSLFDNYRRMAESDARRAAVQAKEAENG